MSSKKAIHETLMLCSFGAEDELVASIFTMGAASFEAATMVVSDG